MKNTLNTRGDGGTGWSKAWKLNFWARLRDGDHAHTMVEQLLKESTADNLFDLHPPFQIDGNFGATAGMTEMLLQSQGDSIDLLPALPAAWSKGNAEGIKARGNVEVDMSWSHGYLTAAVLRPANDGEYKITGKNIALGTITDSKGNKIASKGYDGYVSEPTGKAQSDYIVVDLKGGETYTIYDLDNQDDVAAEKAALTSLITEAKAEQAAHTGKDFFDTEAETALSAAVSSAETALAGNSALFDLIDARETLGTELEAYRASYAVQLKISLEPGVYTGIQQTKLSCTSKLVEIRYTLDGTAPNAESALYNDGIYLPYGKTALTAQPFYKGSPVGEPAAAAYFIGTDDDLAKGASVQLITETAEINGYPLDRIVNGNPESRWATNSNANADTTVEISLKNGTAFNSFMLNEFASKGSDKSRLNSLALEYQDGSEWKTAEIKDENVYLVKGPGEDNEHLYRGVTLEQPITADKVRLVMKGSSISIWEFSLYNTDVTADKSSLSALIAECEKLDTNEYNDSEAFTAALEAARAVAADDNASEIAVISAENTLKSARDEMLGSGSAEDKTLIAVFSNAGKITKPEGNKLRSDWNKADGVTNKNGIKAAGEGGSSTQNPYFFFTADVKLESTDPAIDLDDQTNPIWNSVKLLMRSTNTGSERRSEAAVINNLSSEYISGTMSEFSVRIPLTAVPNRTGNNADVSIDWNDVQEMKFDVEVAKWAVDDGTYAKLGMKVENAKIITTEPGKVWDWTEPDPTDEPDPGVDYTREQLLAELNAEVDPGKYTKASYNTYAGTVENARIIADDENASQKNINRAYTNVVAAKRMLAENPQDNWLATFSKISGDFSILNPTSTQLYADWKQMDQGSLDASENRSDLRLQLRVIGQYKGADAKLQDMLSKLTIKLRSENKSNVEGDPETNNSEHNYGWELSGSQLGDDAVLLLSIPLDLDCTTKKGVMDWADVRNIIVTANLKGDYSKDGANCMMKLSDIRIVDTAPITEGKAKLSELTKKAVDTGNSSAERVAAYNAAKANAEAVASSTDEFLSLYDIDKAYAELESAIDALGSGGDDTVDKSGLNTLIAECEKLDADKYNDSEAFKAALENARAVAADDNASKTEVADAEAELRSARDEMLASGPIVAPTDGPDENPVSVTASAAYADNSVTYSFKASAEKPVSGTVAAAVYDADGRLTGIDVKDNVAADGTEVTGAVSVSEAAAECRIFFWSSLSGARPLADSVTAELNN